MTHKERVLEYMEKFGSITSLDAFRDLGVTRLSAVVFNLKAQGYNIESTPEQGVNRFGEKTRFVRYSLKQ